MGRGTKVPGKQKGAMPLCSRALAQFSIMRSGAELNREILLGAEVNIGAQKVVDDPCEVRAG